MLAKNNFTYMILEQDTDTLITDLMSNVYVDRVCVLYEIFALNL